MANDLNWKDQLKNLNDVVKNIVGAIIELNKRLVTQDQYEKLENNFNKLQENDSVKATILSKLCTLLEVGEKTEELEKKLKSVISDKVEYKKSSTKYAGLYKQKESDYVDLKAEKEKKEVDLRQKENDLTICEKEKEDAEAECEKLKTEIGKLKDYISSSFNIENFDEVEQYDGKLKECSDKLKSKEAQADKWGEAIKEYKKLLDDLEGTKVLSKFLGSKLGSGDEEVKILKLAELVGSKDVFLENIYKDFKKEKQAKKTLLLLSDEEIKFFKAINEFYKHHFSIKFNVFQAPGSEGKDLEWKKQKFDKKCMENIEDPKQKPDFANELCVPMLMALKTGGMSFQALVTASN